LQDGPEAPYPSRNGALAADPQVRHKKCKNVVDGRMSPPYMPSHRSDAGHTAPTDAVAKKQDARLPR